jgi:uncharacterized membrane protein required for colicin V production
MQLVDLLFLVVIVLSASSGWRAGFVVTATGLITWVGSSGLGVRTLPVAFLLALLLARLLLWLFFSRLLAMLPPEAHSNWLNRFLGVLPGLINGIVAAAVIALLFMALPLSDRLT